MATELIDANIEGAKGDAWRERLTSLVALVAGILLIALVILVAHSNQERDAALARERQSYDIMVVTRALDASMARSEASLGRFVISGDRRTGTLYYDEWNRAGRQLARLQQLTAGNPRQAALVAELRTLYLTRGQELAGPATRANFRQGWTALSMFNTAGESSTIPRISHILRQIAANERAVLGERTRAAEISQSRSNRLAGLLSGLGVALVLGAAILGWMTSQAMAGRRAARRAAYEEALRAETLEEAIAARTRELVEVNEQLLAEAKEREVAESQLRQIQKMEAVGQLTGGIAHDFNNMLAVVVGGLELARRRLDGRSADVARHIDNAMEGAKRATTLTRRLLAFARAEPLRMEAVDPSELIAGMSDLLDRTLGERIHITVEQPATPWQIWTDRHQLENAILNLAVNARDAMNGEGRLSIVTENTHLSDGEVGSAAAGEYVRIAVSDSGGGMTPEVMERVFEPFFTTKPVGKGTGLGLSQIFGFARQSDGDVAIQSIPGQGTTVSIYLPRYKAEAGTASAQASAEPLLSLAASSEATPLAGTRVLVVEDDVRVRASTVAALEELGYQPVACESGEEALAFLRTGEPVRLVVTDVVMPGMTGPELVAQLRRLYPELAILFVTGYVGETGDADQLAGHQLLRKPFTINGLAAAVTTALEARFSAPPRAPIAAAAG
jgi:signal transduction histidine kinase/ActR/RegA family two-component response regulator